MNEDQLDLALRRQARAQYHAPPEVPRDEMWAAIQAARGGELARRRAAGQRRWIPWLVGVAATLAVGIGIGRLSMRPEIATLPVAMAPAPRPSQVAPTYSSQAYQELATEHLTRSEALLTSFRSGAAAGRVDAELGPWARDLLSTTRLMLDSPAAADPQLRLLLQDLELVLAQMASLPTTGTAPGARREIELVSQAIEAGDVIPKLRTAIPPGVPRIATED